MSAARLASETSAVGLRELIEPLAACREPLLIGVRHHSAALSRSMASLLDDFAPEALLVELPADLSGWIEYLADPETVAPVAISAVDADGQLGFYPLADFSPELAAVRWARSRGVPTIACDLSVSAKWKTASGDALQDAPHDAHPLTANEPRPVVAAGLLEALLRRTEARDSGQLWERLVESPAIMAAPEAVRQMGLAFGWAIRSSTIDVPLRDLVREAAMRESIRQTPRRSAAIVGAFHAPELTAERLAERRESDSRLLASLTTAPETVGVSLVPYSFGQLDERSGYPAGIRDPVWHQRMVEAASVEQMDQAAVELVVDICGEMRRRGHVAGTPDATEMIRMMRDLAVLRKLPTPGRSELVEALQSCLAQGELFGRAREVARSAERVLVGRRSGRVCASTPRCGLALALDALLAELKLPGRDAAAEEPGELRLDPLRSPRDRARAVVLRQLVAAGIPYASRVDSVAQGARENLGERWQVSWQQGTAATIEAVARFGVTLPQVVEGVLHGRRRRADGSAGESLGDASNGGEMLAPAVLLDQLEIASECGLQTLVRESLDELSQSFLSTAGLAELVAAATVLGRIRAGHLPALPTAEADEYPPIVRAFSLPDWQPRVDALLRASLDRLEGLQGSEQTEDVAGVGDLTQWFLSDLPHLLENRPSGDRDRSSEAAAPERLLGWCRRTLQHGSDRMRGASAGVLVLFEAMPRDAFGNLLEGWFDSGVDADGRRRLRGRLAGAVQLLMPRMQSDVDWLAGLENRLARSSDGEFLKRLPPLRGAFHQFSPADRERLLEGRLQAYQERGTGLSHYATDMASDTATAGDMATAGDPAERAAALRGSDLRGREAIARLMPTYPLRPNRSPSPAPAELGPQAEGEVVEPTGGEISIADRWRMILGLPPQNRTAAGRAAECLDELYGQGRGEGARKGIANRRPSGRGGTEAPEPTTAEWSDDLEKLFGAGICQEVLGEAAAGGRSAAVDLLDPDTVTPSIELLQQVLSLAGGLPESRAEKLRRLAKRITQALAEQLAIRIRPALTGLSTPRPTRRPNRKLNLPRTIRDNLANVYRRSDGRPAVIAKRLIFNSPARREMDWHLTFVVDVSGSMDASVIYSALCAAIFAELQALSVRFLAFSTEVIDLSDHVVDPLTLLLEVRVGGGTHIGLGLRAARTRITVPSRSIVVLVSDFEEGVSVNEMLAEIRALSTAGVQCVGLAAIDDSGTARFHQGYAQLAASAGMSVAAVSPERLARWVGDQVRSRASQQSSSSPGSSAGGIGGGMLCP
ncbi:DUF5682 family protein [Candidatus Laterigemmans baculatus]|uniref:DUF5682 family protein n=1 Tax=Candidatus Laterigemmans baculatus TaxID=2770505 RepID=UPI001F20E655|nr:DUF5682 family protein [Candidatus Laterigemmans baculatus]